MCCGQGDFRPCINLNIEQVHWETARMLMRYSLFHMMCVCHLVVLAVHFSTTSVYSSLKSLSNLVPRLIWGLREGAQRHLSLKCRVNMTTTHMGQLLEQHFHLSLQSSLCPTTQVSTWRDDCAKVMHNVLCPVHVHLSSLLCRKPNNSRLCHPSHQARLLRILCLHTTHLLPQSLLDVLSTWTWGCAATVGRLCKEAHFACFRGILWN